MPCTKRGNHSFLKTWVTTWCSQPKMHRSDRDLSCKSAIINFTVFISVGQYYLTCSGKTLRSSVYFLLVQSVPPLSLVTYILTVFAYKTEGKFLKYLLLVLLKSPNPFNFHGMKNISQLKPEHYMDHARASAVFTFSNVCHDPQCIYVFKNAMILVGSLLRHSISNFFFCKGFVSDTRGK